MANDCRHKMRVHGDPNEVQRLFTEIRGKQGSGNELMDLNSIVPMPRCIVETVKLDNFDVVRAAAENIKTFDEYQKRKDKVRSAAWLETGCEHWSEWAQTEWGSKLNVYYIELSEDESNTLYFCSAWSPVIPALIALSAAFPAVTIEISYAEERGYFLGRGELKDGKKNITKYTIKTQEGRRLYEQFWGEWPGEAADEDKDFIDLTHKAAS